MKQPMQPLYKDDHGVVRFQENAIVRYLLDRSTAGYKTDLNDLAIIPFEQDDQEQFAQLIGYSLSGYGELSYVSDESYGTAEANAEDL